MSFNRYLLTSFVLLGVNTAFSAEKLYYVSDSYRCLDKDYITNLRVELSDESLRLNLHMTRLDSDRRIFEEANINKADIVGGSVIVNDERGNPWFRLQNLDTLDNKQSLVARALKRDKTIEPNCDEVVYKPSQNPMVVLQSEIDELNKRPIKSRQSLNADRQYMASPPIEWLPALDQTAMKESRNKAWKAFNKAFLPATLDLFQKTNGNEKDAKRILSDLADTRIYGRSDSFKKDIRNTVDDAKIYWALTYRNDEKKSTLLAVKSKDEFCDSVHVTNNWNASLRWSAGLPVPMWSRDYASQLLEWAEQCDSRAAERFVTNLKEHWPEVEKMTANFPAFVDSIDSRITTAKTVEAMKKANWLVLSDEEKQKLGMPKGLLGMTQQFIFKPYLQSVLPDIKADISHNLSQLDDLGAYHNYCKSALGFHYARDDFKKGLFEKCQKLSTEFYNVKIDDKAKESVVNAIEKIKSGELAISELTGYCVTNFDNIDNHTARRKLRDKCLSELAGKVLSIGKITVEKAEQDIQNVPQNLDGINQLKSITKRLTLYNTFSANKEMAQARKQLTELFKPTIAKLDKKHKEIDNVLSQQIIAKYQPLVDNEKDLEKLNAAEVALGNICTNLYDTDLSLYQQKCNALSIAMSKKIDEIKCQNTWDKTGFPDEYATMQLTIPRGRGVELKTSLCNAAKSNSKRRSVVAIKDSGIFSSDYLLQATHSQKEGKDLVVTIELKESDKEGFFVYDNLKISKGKIDISNFDNPEQDIIVCLNSPKRCMVK